MDNVSGNARVITVTSGKGGVGKSNVALNLALALSQLGKKVIILDADFGLANVELLLGIIPKHNLCDVFFGDKQIEQVLVSGPMGIKFISGGSGLRELANLSYDRMRYVLSSFEKLNSLCDILIVDTGAGISELVISLIKASSETLLVTTPEPTAITDAYALMKTAKEDYADITPSFKLVVNRADNDKEGLSVYERLHFVSEKFLGSNFEYLGHVPDDICLIRSVKQQRPVLVAFPFSSSAKSVTNLARKLLELPQMPDKGLNSFLSRFKKDK